MVLTDKAMYLGFTQDRGTQSGPALKRFIVIKIIVVITSLFFFKKKCCIDS